MLTDEGAGRLQVCGVIPVRMESRRLPGKPLRSIRGQPMIGWVYRAALESVALDRLVVATDSDRILGYCMESGYTAARTSNQHLCGTDRLIEVMEQETAAGRGADIYVNIQGDEPMVTASHLDLLLSVFGAPEARSPGSPGRNQGEGRSVAGITRNTHGIQVSTLKVAISAEAAGDPNAVKVVTDSRGLALYFSRAPIPYGRDEGALAQHYKHLGFYAYTTEALRLFRSLPPSTLEQAECLEQLRFLENGIPIAVLETDRDTIGVDTEGDLQRVEKYFQTLGS